MKEVRTLSKVVTEYFNDDNVIIYDRNHHPSCFVRIEKMTMKELTGEDDDSPHPAFIVDDVEQDYIYVSKFENVIIDGVAESLPLQIPETDVSFTEAEEACRAKGKGFHLMTATESNLLALLMKKQKEKEERLTGNTGGYLKLTGSSQGSTVGGIGGICDLIGNVGEYVAGLRLKDGEIQVMRDNNAAKSNYSTGENSSHWYGIQEDNAFSKTGRGTYRFAVSEGEASLNTKNKVSKETAGSVKFSDLQTDRHPKRLVTNGVAPKTVTGAGKVQVNLNGERIAVRGGDFRDGGNFSLDLTKTRDAFDEYTGFRCVYCPDV